MINEINDESENLTFDNVLQLIRDFYGNNDNKNHYGLYGSIEDLLDENSIGYVITDIKYVNAYENKRSYEYLVFLKNYNRHILFKNTRVFISFDDYIGIDDISVHEAKLVTRTIQVWE